MLPQGKLDYTTLPARSSNAGPHVSVTYGDFTKNALGVSVPQQLYT